MVFVGLRFNYAPLLSLSFILFVFQVHVTREKPTWAGARIRKKGEGMPNYDNNNLFGTLYITFDIDFPKEEFSDEDKEGNSKFSID